MGIDTIGGLVKRFADHLDEYKSGAYGAQRAKPLVHCAAHRKQATSLIPIYARPMAVLFRLRDNESQVRRDFIDPFFEALGWDMQNKQGFSQTYRHVIHEDSLAVEGSTKAPDYCFQLGGKRMFFVEAKKPAVDLKESVHPAY